MLEECNERAGRRSLFLNSCLAQCRMIRIDPCAVLADSSPGRYRKSRSSEMQRCRFAQRQEKTSPQRRSLRLAPFG